MDNIYILCIETSADLCSVALSENGELIATSTFQETRSHARKILILIQQLLQCANLKLNNLNAIAISSGPGSYTGLRIGYAIAKGLCLSIEIPLIEVNTLLAIATSVLLKYPHYDYYIPMLDARRMEVYSMVVNVYGEIMEEQKPLLLNHESFNNFDENSRILAFGSGSTKFFPISNEKENWQTLPNIAPDATFLIKISYNKYLNNAFSILNICEPIYLKTFSNHIS